VVWYTSITQAPPTCALGVFQRFYAAEDPGYFFEIQISASKESDIYKAELL